MQTSSAMTIHKLTMECTLSSNSPGYANGTVQRRLKEIAADALPRELALALAPLDTDSDAIIFLRKLELDFDIDTSLGQQEIARLWADKIKKNLARKLTSKDSQQLIMFSDKASYLKQFLCDLLQSAAWQQWYYRPFLGLRSLPVSVALRTAILDDQPLGLSAVSQLDDHYLLQLVRQLTAVECQHIVASWSPVVDERDQDEALLTAFLAQMASSISTLAGIDLAQQQQVFYLVCMNLQKGSPVPLSNAVYYSHCLVPLILLKKQCPQTYRDLISALKNKQLSLLKQQLSSEQVAQLLPLLHLSASVIEHYANCIEPRQPLSLPQPIANDKSVLRFSYFGNALLLLPLLDHLPLMREAKTWPALGEQSAASLVRLLSVCLCQSTTRFLQVFNDPVIRELCDVSVALTLQEVICWFNESSQRYEGKVDDRAVADVDNDRVTIQYYQWQQSEQWIRVREENQKGQWLSMTTESLNVTTVTEYYISASEKIISDFNSIWLKQIAIDSGELFNDASCRLLTCAAQQTLKAFAYRVPGFAQSSVNYLLQNFLSMSLTLVAEENRFAAHLSRVPMSIMLNMVGVNRGQVSLPWFDERPICLYESVV